MPSRPIPAIPKNAIDQGRMQFDSAVKENLELLTGRRGARIAPLPSNASTAQIIAKINEIIERLQG